MEEATTLTVHSAPSLELGPYTLVSEVKVPPRYSVISSTLGRYGTCSFPEPSSCCGASALTQGNFSDLFEICPLLVVMGVESMIISYLDDKTKFVVLRSFIID